MKICNKQKEEKVKKEKRSFSKSLLIQESLLIWVLNLAFIALGFYCVRNDFTGSLPWISITLTSAWAAYGVSQAFYYNKSKTENSKNGIIYEVAMKKEERIDKKKQDCD